jgi:coenzyme F420 biosynthesis associated uncharacterized protein
VRPASDLVDWGLAARIGRSFAGSGPPTTPAQRAEVRKDFKEFTDRADQLVREFTGLAPGGAPPAPQVLDRGGWIKANVDGFREIVRPLAEKVDASISVSGLARRVTAAAIGAQLGILLGYLSQKVLGQYDLVLASEGGGRVYYVGPNVLEAEQRSGLNPHDFRLWIALHEVTHRTQFTAVPWLRERVRALIARSIQSMDLDPAHVKRLVERGRDIVLGGPSAWRNVNVMSLLLSEDQREVLTEMQALMCVVEGHGTFVMNRVGAREIPSFASMKEALEARRGAKGPEKVFQRAIGMDMKYEQYVLGEKFCDAVADEAGLDAVNRVWEREENLPTLEEMRAPATWLERVR